MLETWGDSWFKERASRVFYVVPAATVDADPAAPQDTRQTPAVTVRAFVGQVEVITRAMETILSASVTRQRQPRRSKSLRPCCNRAQLAIGSMAGSLSPTDKARMSSLLTERLRAFAAAGGGLLNCQLPWVLLQCGWDPEGESRIAMLGGWMLRPESGAGLEGARAPPNAAIGLVRRVATPARLPARNRIATDIPAMPSTPLRLTDQEAERARRILMRRDPQAGAGNQTGGPLQAPRLSDARAVPRLDRCHPRAAALEQGRRNHLRSGGCAGRRRATISPPAAILAADPVALRAAGVSGPKISYLRDLATRVT